MSFFRCEPTSTAQWHALVIEATKQTGYRFDESLESYLVITLEHFTTKDEWVNSIIALDFLSAIELTGSSGNHVLRNVGDQCLLISGLFPERVLRKNVSLNYLISIGQQAYYTLAFARQPFAIDTELFEKLGVNFIGLMDVLHTMRDIN